ncbi:MAG: hypothetical protein JWP36_231 [Paucimonas sp.]|nr:hypothetical protein [Paucimonas sp.]
MSDPTAAPATPRGNPAHTRQVSFSNAPSPIPSAPRQPSGGSFTVGNIVTRSPSQRSLAAPPPPPPPLNSRLEMQVKSLAATAPQASAFLLAQLAGLPALRPGMALADFEAAVGQLAARLDEPAKQMLAAALRELDDVSKARKSPREPQANEDADVVTRWKTFCELLLACQGSDRKAAASLAASLHQSVLARTDTTRAPKTSPRTTDTRPPSAKVQSVVRSVSAALADATEREGTADIMKPEKAEAADRFEKTEAEEKAEKTEKAEKAEKADKSDTQPMKKSYGGQKTVTKILRRLSQDSRVPRSHAQDDAGSAADSTPVPRRGGSQPQLRMPATEQQTAREQDAGEGQPQSPRSLSLSLSRSNKDKLALNLGRVQAAEQPSGENNPATVASPRRPGHTEGWLENQRRVADRPRPPTPVFAQVLLQYLSNPLQSQSDAGLDQPGTRSLLLHGFQLILGAPVPKDLEIKDPMQSVREWVEVGLAGAPLPVLQALRKFGKKVQADQLPQHPGLLEFVRLAAVGAFQEELLGRRDQ